MALEVDHTTALVIALTLFFTMALVWAVLKYLGFLKAEPSDPLYTAYIDSLPPLGDTLLTASEISHRRTQEGMKKQIENIEKHRQLAFEKVCRITTQRIKIAEKIHKLQAAVKKLKPPRDIGRIADMKKAIRYCGKEHEELYGIVDDVSHQMYLMLMQRLTLRRKIDSLDLQMERDRLAELLYPQIHLDLGEYAKEDVNKE